MWISRDRGLPGGVRTSAPRWAEGTESWRHHPRHGPEETGPADSSHHPALTKRKALGRLREFPSISPLSGALWGNGAGKSQACVPLWKGIWTLQHLGQLPICQVSSRLTCITRILGTLPVPPRPAYEKDCVRHLCLCC